MAIEYALHKRHGHEFWAFRHCKIPRYSMFMHYSSAIVRDGSPADLLIEDWDWAYAVLKVGRQYWQERRRAGPADHMPMYHMEASIGGVMAHKTLASLMTQPGMLGLYFEDDESKRQIERFRSSLCEMIAVECGGVVSEVWDQFDALRLDASFATTIIKLTPQEQSELEQHRISVSPDWGTW